MKNEKLKTYKGFKYKCEDSLSEEGLKRYIDSLGENPSELPDVSEENYALWCCDYNFSGVVYLELPETIRRIGKCVFAQSKLQNLVANGVESIDELAFYNTKELETVRALHCKELCSTDPVSKEKSDGSDAFNHSHVRAIEMPELRYAGRYAFYDMPNIEVLDFPNMMRLEPHAIYGNDSLIAVKLISMRRAGYSIITMNKNLARIQVPSLFERDKMAFHSNGDARVFAMPGVYVASIKKKSPEVEYDERTLMYARREESVSYDFNYKGFWFNFVDGLGEQERRKARTMLERDIDMWIKEGRITPSLNKDSNESGHESLQFVKDFYASPLIKEIGDYAFSKCYSLESVVAPAVRIVGDHAFYCDGGVKYIDLPECVSLKNDAFNGTAIDGAEDEDKHFPKLLAPKVRGIGKHAFWQTGFRVLEFPECSSVKPTAFEENPELQRIMLKRLDDDLAIILNPELREVIVDDLDLKTGLYGNGGVVETRSDSSEFGDDK